MSSTALFPHSIHCFPLFPYSLAPPAGSGAQKLANLELSQQLREAALSSQGVSNFPARSPLVTEHETTYWRLMEEGTKQPYPNVTADEVPYLWDHTQCMEVDGQVGDGTWELGETGTRERRGRHKG